MNGLPFLPVVFAYNFPHKKTQDFLYRLVLLGAQPRLVLLANPVKLNIPPTVLRTKPRHCDLVHPQAICERFDIPYEVVDHSGTRCVSLLTELRPEFGIVAGARILPSRVVRCFSYGIVNFHPGLIPEVRGLDALQWAVHLGLPLGVTAHLIDHRVDAGRIVERRTIEEYADDTLIDLSLRLHETQIQMLSSTIEIIASRTPDTLPFVADGNYRRSFPAELTASLPQKLAERLARLRKAA